MIPFRNETDTVEEYDFLKGGGAMYRKNYERAKKRRRRILIVKIQLMVITIFVIFVVFMIYNGIHTKDQQVLREEKELKQEQQNPKKEEKQSLTKEKQTNETEIKKRVNSKEAKKIWKKNKELLVLVNKENICPEKEFNRRKICNGRIEAADIIYSDLCQMLTDAGKEGYNYWIASGYRSAMKQQKLVDQDVQAAMNQGLSYDDALEKTYEETMPAGYSEHQTGLALDILSSSNLNMDITQENTEENRWLTEHCYEYGFILRYPKDKENITKISYEPWHFRYVGKEAAKYMKENQLTLEEFYLSL